MFTEGCKKIFVSQPSLNSFDFTIIKTGLLIEFMSEFSLALHQAHDYFCTSIINHSDNTGSMYAHHTACKLSYQHRSTLSGCSVICSITPASCRAEMVMVDRNGNITVFDISLSFVTQCDFFEKRTEKQK